MDAELEGVRERLEAIADELADLALDRLRQAADGGDAAALAALERRVTRARRAVEKAAALLGAGHAADPDQPGW